MKCFNHEDREAVASCQQCGKGLCKECASKYTPCLCDECYAARQRQFTQQAQAAEERQRQKYIASLEATCSGFVKSCIAGIILVCLVIGLLYLSGEIKGLYKVTIANIGVLIFCMPFGWRITASQQNNIPFFAVGDADMAIGMMLGSFIIRFFICIFVGVPVFIYQLVKAIPAYHKLKQLKK